MHIHFQAVDAIRAIETLKICITRSIPQSNGAIIRGPRPVQWALSSNVIVFVVLQMLTDQFI